MTEQVKERKMAQPCFGGPLGESDPDVLPFQMKNISNGRREELEELQFALMDESAAVISLTRELETVQMQVEHQTDNTKELEYLRERVYELENQRESSRIYMYSKNQRES